MKRTIYSKSRYPWLDTYEWDTWEHVSGTPTPQKSHESDITSRTQWVLSILAIFSIIGFLIIMIWMFPYIKDMISQAMSIDLSASIMQAASK